MFASHHSFSAWLAIAFVGCKKSNWVVGWHTKEHFTGISQAVSNADFAVRRTEFKLEHILHYRRET